MWKEIRQLIRKDFRLEFRQRYAFYAVLLFVLSTVYIAYLSFHRLTDRSVWNALFWIIAMFSAINTAGKSFQNESGGRFWYYAQMIRPQSLILSKLLYNAVLLVVIDILTYIVFSGLLGHPIADSSQFLVILILGSIGFSTVLTTVAAIASKTDSNTTLMSILSLPLLLPLLLTLMRATFHASMGEPWDVNLALIGTLTLLNLLTGVLAYALFPYLWRE